MSNTSKYLAEVIGTAVLVFFGCGAAVVSSPDTWLGWFSVAFAFGLVIIAMAYSIGTVSGCHINPAVSFAMFLNKRISSTDFIGYVVSQFIGATIGGGLLYMVLKMGDYKVGMMGTNGFGQFNAMGAFVVEIILTFVFVLTIMAVTGKRSNINHAGLVIGFTLVLVHIVGIPLTGTSVNPARSFGPAVFVGGDALSQLWVFIVAPLVGAALAAFTSKFVLGSEDK